jgi:hypothetical protein
VEARDAGGLTRYGGACIKEDVVSMHQYPLRRVCLCHRHSVRVDEGSGVNTFPYNRRRQAEVAARILHRHGADSGEEGSRRL